MFKRIQTLRLLLKQTKVLKGKSSRFIYTRRLRTINSQFTKSIINCNLCTGKELLTISTENQQRSLRGKDVKTINDLFAFIMQGKEFYMKLLVNIFNTIKFEELNEKQAILLLNCCGKDVYDSSKESRDNICQKLYTHFLKNNLITPNICRTYINVCTENNVAVDLENFLNQLTFEPDQEVIKDLMKNVCNKGNIQSALKLLEIMKNIGFPIDEDVFNSLVYAHVLVGGIENANPVLQTMKIAQIPESKATNYALFKGTVTLGNENDFLKFLQTTQFKLSENYLLEILECVGLNGNHSWMPKILSLIKEKPQSLEFKTKLKQLCVHLVHMNQAESSMSIYRTFSEPTKEEKYGFFLLKEMLHCDLPINVIIKLAKQLKEENLNETIIGDLTEIALRHKYVESAWQLLENMDELRPHFFWPLLINARNTEGETEVINIVKRMMEKNIKPDFETLESYIIPFCKIDNSKLFIYTFEKLGFTVKEVLSPLVCVLLNLNRVTEAENICRSYNVRLFGETFLNSLSFAWNNSKNCESIVFLLQRYCESEILFSRNDIVGEFLIKSIHLCRTINDITDFIKLLKTFHKKKLTISCVSLNVLKDILMINVSSEHLRKQLEENLESIVDYTLQMESSSIPHPNEMTLNELECHLVELEEKNMETRGVLRKLIQIHCNANNSQRVNELYEKFLERGYEESPGILSSLMQLYIKNGETEAALNIYNKLKTKYSNFNLDGFKIFHLAAALVKNSKFDEAFSIVESEFQSKKFVEPRTCVYLLNSFDNEEQQLKMFNYLIENRICKPVNIVLGPLVRLHLKNKQLEKAVETYINLAEKYKCTPLQLEIFCAILEVKNQDLLKKVTDVTEKVHGSLGASIAMICALAEMGMDKSLIKFLTTLEIRVLNEINKRCQRWIKEGKTLPLETLAKVSVKFPTILDLKTICDSLMQIYELNGDCQSAINLYESLIDSNEELVNKSLKQKLISLLNKHKYDIPKIVNISV